MTESNSDELISLATIGKPVGLHGYCRLFAHGETLKSLNLPFELIAQEGRVSRTVTLTKLIKEPKAFRARFAEFSSRESVDEIKNLQLKISQSNLPKKDGDDFYHFELEGMTVIAEKSKEIIGKVVMVHNYPTLDALDIRQDTGAIFVLPLTKEAVLKIDREKKEIIADDSIIEELL